MAEQYIAPSADEADFNFDTAYVASPPLSADFDFALAVFYAMAGNSNIFTAIWADTTTGRNTGKLYALSWGPGTALSVLDLSNKVLYDYYTNNSSGRVDETLTNTDTRDLNVDIP